MTNAKTNKQGFQTLLLRTVSLTLAMLMLLFSLASCSKKKLTDEEQIRECVETFLTSYNDGDMEAAMECLDSKSRNAMKAMLNLLGGLAGSYLGFDIDLKDLFSLGVSTVNGNFMNLEITGISIHDDKNAVVTTTMDLTGAGVSTIYFVMVYEKGGWYISDMTDRPQFSGNNETPGNNAESSYYVSTYCNMDEFENAGTYTVYSRQQFDVGDTVVLEATVNDGYNFEGWYTINGWDDVCLSTDLRYAFEMKAQDVNIEARYSYYTVSTDSWSDDYGNAGTYTKYSGEKFSIGDTVVLEATVNDGYNFEGWYTSVNWEEVCLSTDLYYEFEMTAQSIDVEARYSYYTVGTYCWTDEYGTAGTYTKYDAEKFSIGDVVVLEAKANEGFNFEGWYRDDICLSKDPCYTFEMKAESIDLEARFSYYTVRVTGLDDDYNTAGTFTSKEDEKVSIGETVTLTATVNKGYNFEGWFLYWSDICLSEDLTYTFEMKPESVWIEAKYSYYTLTVSGWNEYGQFGTYTAKDNEKVSIGDSVTLTATANSGYRFEGWFRDGICVSADLTYTFNMEECDMYIEPRWEMIEN